MVNSQCVRKHQPNLLHYLSKKNKIQLESKLLQAYSMRYLYTYSHIGTVQQLAGSDHGTMSPDFEEQSSRSLDNSASISSLDMESSTTSKSANFLTRTQSRL